MSIKKLVGSILLMTVSSVSLAHPGHDSDFMGGVLHPLSGWDHLLAMMAVGLWAAQLGGRAIWTVPASFVTVMALAGWMGATGMALPMVESGIATSVLVLGLLIAFSVRAGPILAGGLVGLFAGFHGYAHGAEMPHDALWYYGLGFVLATTLLHGIGVTGGICLRNQSQWLKAAGAVVAVIGLGMVALT